MQIRPLVSLLTGSADIIGGVNARADHAIVVFGCGARPDGTPSRALRHRLEHALHEARRDPNAIIIVSGNAVANHVVEADAMRTWLIERGVASERILTEPMARYTLQNARHVAPLVAGLGASRVSLVTERYHLQRSATLLRRELERIGVEGTLNEIAVPDGLSDAELRRSKALERFKLTRDLGTQRIEWWGHFFDPARFARTATA